MTHGELVTLTWSSHAAVFVGALAAWYKYGDRSEIFAKSLSGTDETLRRMRTSIASDLSGTLESLLEEDSSEPQPILGPDGAAISYVERPVNFLHGEAYRESVATFLNERADSLADYRALAEARAGWCFWTRFLSWLIYVTLAWQFLAGGVGVLILDKVLSVALPDWLIQGTLIVTALLILTILAFPLRCILSEHDRIMKFRTHYNAP